jgi:hypothetical protein
MGLFWVYGCMDVWGCFGCMGVWMCGGTGACVCEWVVVGVYGCQLG